MGCGKSSEKPTQEAARRRLSVGHVDKDGEETGGDVAEDDRGLITALNEESVLKMLQDDTGGRKFSIGSDTDQGKTSFANKTTKAAGDEVDEKASGLGYTCRKGLKPESPNQDSWTVMKVEGKFSIYGVFDGHGQKGHDVSNFVKDNLPKLILRDQRFKTDEKEQMLKDAFKKVQNLVSTADRMKKLSAQMSGTTCSVAIHDHEQKKLTVAHVADSTVVLANFKEKGGAIQAITLTRDHKPNLKDERARIEKAGGRVVFDGYANHRIYAKNGRYPGLNMSRCLGDLMGHADAGCSAEPEVSTRELTDLDHILLLCSDGVWEFMQAVEVVNLVNEFPAAKAMVAAERLAKEAWDRWIREEGGAVVDDITVVLVYLAQT